MNKQHLSSTKLIPWWGGTNLAISFSDYGEEENGTWSYDGSSWSKLSGWPAAGLNALGASGTGDLVGIFADNGSDNGVWQYYSGSWLRITDSIPADIVSWNSNSAAILVNGYDNGENGIWSYDGVSLSMLTGWICDN